MTPLKIKDLTNLIIKLKNEGMTYDEINELPIYLGNDDELNGIHTAWFIEKVDKNTDDEDEQYLVNMINEDCHNAELKGKAILIS